jgi:hypothetical protein
MTPRPRPLTPANQARRPDPSPPPPPKNAVIRRRADLGDDIQEAVIAAAAELCLTAYALTQEANRAAAMRARAMGAPDPESWTISEDAVRAYLTRRSSMGTHKVQYLMWALGLRITMGR